jgi:hypothetical protein
MTSLLDLMCQQHSDPISFLDGESISDRELWYAAWFLRGGMTLVVLAALGVAAILSGHSGVRLVAHAMLAIVSAMLLIGLAVTITDHPQFWLLYLCSPPMLVIALLCGLGPLSLVGWVLGWGIGAPLFLGALLLDAGTLWVHNQTFDARRDQLRWRAGGPMSELPALALWDRVRIVRLAVAMGCALLAVAIPLFRRDQLTLMVCLALLACAAGCLRLGATLIGSLCKLPLVAYDERLREWRSTYIGRSVLFIPLEQIHWAIGADRSALRHPFPSTGLRTSDGAQDTTLDASAALLALLGQSSLGPVVRRAVGKLSSEQAHWLVLHLSLQGGGAAAIRYLQPALPQPLLSTAERYAAFADEAAKPLDLQRWITVLEKQPDWDQGITVQPALDVTQTLAHARDALSSCEYVSVLNTALCDLRQLVQVLYGITVLTRLGRQSNHLARSETGQSRDGTGKSDSRETLPLSWPVALLAHVESHRTRLIAD